MVYLYSRLFVDCVNLRLSAVTLVVLLFGYWNLFACPPICREGDLVLVISDFLLYFGGAYIL